MSKLSNLDNDVYYESMVDSCLGECILKAISVDDLQQGMILARSLVNDEMVVILSADTVLTKAHITRLNFLNIPVVYIKDNVELQSAEDTTIFNRGNAFTKEYTGVVNVVHSIFNELSEGKVERVETAKTVVSESVMPMVKNSGVIDFLFDINHLASDVYNHSLRVSILAGVIAKWLHFGPRKSRDIVLAGFLHDIGKSRFPERLVGKNVNKLKGEDYNLYVRHTMDGHQILNSMEGLSEGVRLTAMQHHERMDGTGFPFHSVDADIHEYARIIAIADIYDNITTEREGYVKQTPFHAIDYITKHLYTSMDPVVAVPVLTRIKDAFLGSRVVLSNGLGGIIVTFPNDFAARPIVSISRGEIVNLNDFPEIEITEYNPK